MPFLFIIQSFTPWPCRVGPPYEYELAVVDHGRFSSLEAALACHEEVKQDLLARSVEGGDGVEKTKILGDQSCWDSGASRRNAANDEIE